MKKICVVGAGSSGLTAIKACKEEGFAVDCFETSEDFGGLWRFHDDTVDGKPSVMRSTVINTSKEMSAYSDFPPPKEFANFMHHSHLLEYFRLYAERFDLLRHVRYRSKVVRAQMADDYRDTGRWRVTVLNLEDGGTSTDEYDGVMVCTGHHTFPYSPQFEGLEDFQGNVRHSHTLKSEKGYEDRNVLVIGIGNSGVDSAVELSRVTKKLYLSTRHGSWIFSRLSFYGRPLDMFLQKRILLATKDYYVAEYLLETLLNLKFDHEKYGLKPNHGVFSAHLTINDALPNSVLSGRITIKQDVERFTKDGVVFEGETVPTPIDDVVLATGYQIKYDFLSKEVIEVKNNKVDLYKLMFPVHLPHPSLAFIGLIQPFGSIFPVAEAQSRWYAQLMKGKCSLPSTDDMKKEVEKRHNLLSKRFVSSQRHTIQEDYLRYMDEIHEQFGAKPNFWKMAYKDPYLFYVCMFGPCVSYQYRLEGPHAWDGARDAILSVQERVDVPLQTRKKCI